MLTPGVGHGGNKGRVVVRHLSKTGYTNVKLFHANIRVVWPTVFMTLRINASIGVYYLHETSAWNQFG